MANAFPFISCLLIILVGHADQLSLENHSTGPYNFVTFGKDVETKTALSVYGLRPTSLSETLPVIVQGSL